jgi:hypothetical protein
MSGVVDSGLSSGHGNIDATDPNRTAVVRRSNRLVPGHDASFAYRDSKPVPLTRSHIRAIKGAPKPELSQGASTRFNSGD